MKISEKAVSLMLRFEGVDVASRWPGLQSGITIPYGYDCGFEANFESDWGGLLPKETMGRLRPVIGLKGQAARRVAPTLRGLTIPLSAAKQVFENSVIPREEATTAKVFPGSDTLPADAFGGLVSLIYNRGPLVDKTPRRREMLQLFQLFRKGAPFDLQAIGDLVEAQKRLWPHVRDSDGDLWTRRIAEAALIRDAQ